MKLYLLGGRPCSGKTTLSYHLGQKHNIEVKYLDVFAQKCIDEATEATPNIYRSKNRELTDVLQKDPNILFDEYVEFYEEMFPLLLNELASYEKSELILEASILLPKFIDYLTELYDVKICYLVTDDEFVKERYVKRDYVEHILTMPNGEIALKNLLERDSIFAKYILDEIKRYELPKIHVKSEDDIESAMNSLEKIFAL